MGQKQSCSEYSQICRSKKKQKKSKKEAKPQDLNNKTKISPDAKPPLKTETTGNIQETTTGGSSVHISSGKELPRNATCERDLSGPESEGFEIASSTVIPAPRRSRSQSTKSPFRGMPQSFKTQHKDSGVGMGTANLETYHHELPKPTRNFLLINAKELSDTEQRRGKHQIVTPNMPPKPPTGNFLINNPTEISDTEQRRGKHQSVMPNMPPKPPTGNFLPKNPIEISDTELRRGSVMPKRENLISPDVSPRQNELILKTATRSTSNLIDLGNPPPIPLRAFERRMM